MGKPTFPDQQQDLQNAAEHSLARECDGNVKFPGLSVEADLRRIGCRDGVRVGLGVSTPYFGVCDHPSACLWSGYRLTRPLKMISPSFRSEQKANMLG